MRVRVSEIDTSPVHSVAVHFEVVPVDVSCSLRREGKGGELACTTAVDPVFAST
jgi:hypothetical protein